ncbi:MAG TPA: substrate-binding domain-containing protein [Prolixibacteraceae bacterium]|nr:substrate-binding domain-containing protein [Prolixibacteraceae bacterium]
MHPRQTIKYLIFFLFLLLVSTGFANTKFKVGFSQCTTADKWRQAQIRLMQIELAFYPDLELTIKDAKDNNETQIRQIEEFLAEGIDLLIVSPNESDPLTPVIEKVFKQGIPVILIDRLISSESYTAYIGGDNYQIGEEAGKYAARLLKGKGKVVEITGLDGSSPAIERSNGFTDALKNYPEIEIEKSISGDWNFDKAREVMQKIIDSGIEFDLVFGHNDVMAHEAHAVFKESGRKKHCFFLGVDGLPGSDAGIQFVLNKDLDATFLYPTNSDQAIKIASEILHQKHFEREVISQTLVIDSTNAKILKVQTEQIESLQEKIEAQTSFLDLQITKYQSQRLILIFVITLLLLIVILVFVIYNAFINKAAANRKLEAKNRKIEKQNLEILDHRDKLVEVSRQLEEASQAKLRFFTNVSHEFRTPLTLIKGPLENLMTDQEFSPEKLNLFKLMHRNTVRLLRLVNQLMDFRKLDNKKMGLHTTENDLLTFVKEIEESFASLASSRNIELKIDCRESELKVWFDVDKLDKVFFNIISNAFKFTSDYGKITIQISRSKPIISGIHSEEVQIEISDTGKGIPEKDLDKIFDRFYQAGKSEAYLGTGLGLNLSKEFIELHRGRISAKSEEGIGTTFIICLPLGNEHLLPDEILADSEKTEIKLQKEYSKIEEASTVTRLKDSTAFENRPVILVVEDIPDVREFIRMSLGNQYLILEATNGKEGLVKVLEEEPDLIISDVMMPVMDGLELTRQLKTDLKTCHIPIILLTAKATLEHKLEGLEEGADSYIPKPFNSKHLEIRVKKLLESRMKIREHYRGMPEFQEEEETGLSRLDKKFLARLTMIIGQNIGKEDMSVEELSEKAGMSRVHLYRKIKKLTDMSVSEFVIVVKLKKSLELLRNSGKTIAEIAYEVGFSSPSYYTRCFRDQFKMSPTDYMQNKKGEQ